MTLDRERIETGARLAREALDEGLQSSPSMLAQSRFNGYWNPEFALEVVREVERLNELLNEWLLLGNLPGGGFGGTLEARTRAAVANPAAEAGE